MWTMIHDESVHKQFRSLGKKFRLEVINVLANLETVKKALDEGIQLEQLKKLGFVHNEPKGIVAVDQKGKGGKTKPKALRLYLYPDFSQKQLYVIRLADKSQQPNDIKIVTQYVESLIRRQEEGDSQESP
ncbi:MAG: hypothetical protein KDA88_08200 [Planctomycetaceae bacterium]|nr:hypothetical protein [Planctomycetaceae bacterium]